MSLQSIIKQINLIEKEQKRRYNNNKILRYNNGELIHQKQLLFHKCNKKNRWVFGGNRSGKTECGAVESIWLTRGIHPYKKNKSSVDGWVVSVSTQVQRDVAQSKILNYLNKDWIIDIVMLSGKKCSPEHGIIDFILIKNVLGGVSKLGFKSCDQGREKFQGTSLDFVWFDEEPPLDIYMECKMRIIDRCGEIFGTMTPLKSLSWVYDTIYLNSGNDEEVWHIHMNWEDNPFLDSEEIKKMASTMSEDELKSRKYGEFRSFGGLVYPEFLDSVNVIEPFKVPLDWYNNICIDPGYKNPLSAHWYAVDFDGNIYVIAEHYEANKTIEYHTKKIVEISNNLKWHRASNGMINALIDSAANQRTLSAEKSVAELFYENGINVNTKVNKDLFSGIQRVKGFLKNSDGESKLFIFSNCVNMIKEIKGYFWGNDDVPIKKDDHAMDELRYFIMSRPISIQTKQKLNIIEKDKLRLIKNLKNKYY